MSGKTLVILADDLDGTVSGFAWCCNNSGLTKGWDIGFSGGRWIIKVHGASGIVAQSNVAGTRRSCLAITLTAATSGTLNFSVDGGAVQTAGAGAITYTATDGTCTNQIGVSTNDSNLSFNPATVCELMVIGSVLNASQLQQVSGVTNTDNRMQLSPVDTLAASVTFWWKAGRDWSGVQNQNSISLGSSPITFTTNGPLCLLYIAEDLIVPSFVDSVTAAPEQTGNVRHECYARTRVNTTGVARIAVDVIETQVGSSSASPPGAAIYIDGTYNSLLASPSVDGLRHVVDLLLPAGNHAVDIWDGAQAFLGLSGAGNNIPIVAGSYAYRIRVTTSQAAGSLAAPSYSLSGPPAASSRLVVYGDSIMVGFGASNAPQNGVGALVRVAYPGGVSLHVIEADAIYYSNTLGTTTAQMAATLVALAQQTFGIKNIWICVSTNDYGQSLQGAGAFGTMYAALVDAIFALDPTIIIWCQSGLTRATETPNTFGNSFQEYRSQIAALVSARSSRSSVLRYVEGKTFLTTADLSDGLHPTTAGHAKYAAAIRATLGY